METTGGCFGPACTAEGLHLMLLNSLKWFLLFPLKMFTLVYLILRRKTKASIFQWSDFIQVWMWFSNKCVSVFMFVCVLCFVLVCTVINNVIQLKMLSVNKGTSGPARSLAVSAPITNVSAWWRWATRRRVLSFSGSRQRRTDPVCRFNDGDRRRGQSDDHVWGWVGGCSLRKRGPVTAVAVRLRVHAGEAHRPLRTPSAARRQSPAEDQVRHQHVQGVNTEYKRLFRSSLRLLFVPPVVEEVFRYVT